MQVLNIKKLIYKFNKRLDFNSKYKKSKMTETKHSFRMTVDTNSDVTNSDDSIKSIIYTYQNEFGELFQDCSFTHNIKITHVEENIYLIEYPKNDINFMYKYLCDDDKLNKIDKCIKLNTLFANPADDD